MPQRKGTMPFIGKQDRRMGRGRYKGSGPHGVCVWLAQRESYRPGAFVLRFNELRSESHCVTATVRKLAVELDKEVEQQGQPISIRPTTLHNYIRRNYPQLVESREIEEVDADDDDGKHTQVRDLGLVVAKLCDELGASFEDLLASAKEDIGLR